MSSSLVDAEVQAAVKLALLSGVRDIHITVPKITNTSRYHNFGSDYRVRLLDTAPNQWSSILKGRMDIVLDYTGGFYHSGDHEGLTVNAVQSVLAKSKGRYIGCLCNQHTIHKAASGGKNSSYRLLPEGLDLQHFVQWTTTCMRYVTLPLYEQIIYCILQMAIHSL